MRLNAVHTSKALAQIENNVMLLVTRDIVTLHERIKFTNVMTICHSLITGRLFTINLVLI